MTRMICVYCSSSDKVAPVYFDAARELGLAMAARGYGLIYGGTSVGLMGAVARAVHEGGGQVVGVIPEAIHREGISYDLADELIVTRDMRERKAAMENRATAFVALPGGFGTLEELFEILTLKQLRYHHKPLMLLDVDGFYKPLEDLFTHMYKERFAREEYRELYHFAPTVDALFTYLDGYQPPAPIRKWG